MSNDEKNRRVSKAPAPIEPLSGGGTTRWQPLRPNSAPHGLVNDMDAGNRKPRWDKWRLMPKVRISEAVALSLDIEPTKLKPLSHGWMAGDNKPRFDESDEFSDRLEVAIANGDKFSHSRNSVPLAEFASWASVQWKIPKELAALAVSSEKPPTQSQKQSDDEAAAELFDSVKCEALEQMFPANGQWKGWCEHAKRNGLLAARVGRGTFNPYRAARFFHKQGVTGWDWARCERVLVKGLPVRSKDKEYLLTGKIS